MKTKTIEGVTYYRYRVAFRLVSSGRKRRTFWSPGHPWVRTEIARWLDGTYGIEAIVPQSVTFRIWP